MRVQGVGVWGFRVLGFSGLKFRVWGFGGLRVWGRRVSGVWGALELRGSRMCEEHEGLRAL